jgi:hypothetical protein
MRQATNILFSRMDGIWSGKLVEPPLMQKRYAEINRVLVELFQRNLSSLEAGKRFDGERVTLEVRAAEKEIENRLGDCHMNW